MGLQTLRRRLIASLVVALLGSLLLLYRHRADKVPLRAARAVATDKRRLPSAPQLGWGRGDDPSPRDRLPANMRPMIRFFTPAAFLLSGTLLGVAPLPLWARSKARPREPTSVLVVRVEDGTGCKLDQAAQVLLEQSLARQPALSPARAPAAEAVPPTPEAIPTAAAGAVAPLQPARPAVDAGAAAQGLLLRVVACQDRLGTGPEGRVTPYETYHIKLAIADVGDNAYNSGVLIEGRSIVSDEKKYNVLYDKNSGNN